MYIACALTISALMRIVNLEDMEMNVRSILSSVIRTYNLNFRYDTAEMTSFRSILVASDNGALRLMTSRATST